MRIAIALPCLLLLSAAASSRAAAPVDFAHEVISLITTHCAKCHTAGRHEGDLSMDTRELLLEAAVFEPGAAADSELIRRVTSDDLDERMPPKGPPLTAAEIDVLRRWIDQGAPWEPGFTFKKSAYEAPLEPRRPDLPPVAAGVTNPIDRIVQAYWREHKITAPPPASDAAFCRRVHLDLVGLLPTPGDLEAFVADKSPDKQAVLVKRLLSDRVAYADHWITFWNDLLRNDYAGTGYINGGRKQITAWLYKALLDDMPYDEFVRQLVAPSPDSEGFANGFVWRGNVNASQRTPLQFAQNVGQVFLGINLKCASCHDSFIDDWKLKDAYGLAAITSDEPLELYRCDKPTGEMAEARFLLPSLGQIDASASREERLKQLAGLMTSPQNGRLNRTVVNRLWHRLMGRGIVHPVDSMGTTPWSADLLDELAVDLSDAGYDLKKTLELIATSQVYASQCVPWDEGAPIEDYVFAGPAPKRMTAEQFCDALAQLTGVAPEATAKNEIFVRAAADEQGRVGRSFVRASLIKTTPLMRTLGRPNREQVVTTRPSELTTLEAIELSNGQALTDLLKAGAEHLVKAHPGASTKDVCREVFAAALQRHPTPDELSRLTSVAGDALTSEGLADALWCIVMLPEFQVIR